MVCVHTCHTKTTKTISKLLDVRTWPHHPLERKQTSTFASAFNFAIYAGLDFNICLCFGRCANKETHKLQANALILVSTVSIVWWHWEHKVQVSTYVVWFTSSGCR